MAFVFFLVKKTKIFIPYCFIILNIFIISDYVFKSVTCINLFNSDYCLMIYDYLILLNGIVMSFVTIWV